MGDMTEVNRRLENIAARIEGMNNKVDGVSRQVDAVSGKVDAVWVAIQGDDEIGAKGLMRRVRDLEKQERLNRLENRIDSLEQFRSRAIWVATGAVVGSSGLTALILEVLLK